MVNAPQNWKNLKKEDIPMLTLCLNRELFVLAKHTVYLRCQLWQFQNSSVCFKCHSVMPPIMLPSTHGYSLTLPSQIREISVLFSYPQTEVIGWNAGGKGEKEGQGIDLPSLILPSLSATGTGTNGIHRAWWHSETIGTIQSLCIHIDHLVY